ncbi:bifunctional DNA primase/polymerase [bacterium]|nr:bifunctional DNA primase/polymerase [bacterium]
MDNKNLIPKNNSLQHIDNKLSIVDQITNSDYIVIYQAAKRFFNIGLNITCIHQIENEHNKLVKDKLKHPCHEYKYLSFKRQTEAEFKSYDWKKSVGLGSVCGFNNLVVIDIDDCHNKNFLNLLLSRLGLPENYQWVVQSGSRAGFHIIILAKKPTNLSKNQVVTTYEPTEKLKPVFGKIELLWNTHVVLPPSLHKSGNNYSFLNSIPDSEPVKISTDKLVSTIEIFVNVETKKNGEGYNK